MVALRDPESGCPWDLEQDFASIAPYTIEEAYEVADAIDRGDLDDLRDELGDLLLQVVFHAQMADEQGAFNFAAVTEAITAKMLRRHPHVFGDEKVRTLLHRRWHGKSTSDSSVPALIKQVFSTAKNRSSMRPVEPLQRVPPQCQ